MGKLLAAVLLPAMMLALGDQGAMAASRKKQRKTADSPAPAATAETAPRPKVSQFSKFLKDIVDKAEGDSLSLYRSSKGKIYLGMDEGLSGRRFLLGGTVVSVSDPSLAPGSKLSSPTCFEAVLEDSLVVLYQPVTAAVADSDHELALQRSYIRPVVKRIPLTLRAADAGGKLVFEITQLVTSAAPKGKEFSSGLSDNSSYYGRLKVFGDNASVLLHQNVSISGGGGSISGTMSSTVSLLLLPAKGMRPRIQDSRVGTFSTGGPFGKPRYKLSSDSDGLVPFRLANRWRIEPSDVEAWRAGKSVTVRKPIIWYIDDSFPESWRQPVREGVLAWNKAFERLGLKDVLQVRDFPSSDADFDPDNLKYNCIRYVPSTTMNAMGPSWADPETGEILNATVLVYNDVVRLVNNWRFVQTAQVDPRARATKLPDELIAESLVYVVSHEIGHTLGLLHNMGASAAIKVEDLRSPSFTAVHGTTPSIMDYARFNYVAQPGDVGVRLTPPSLGVYDCYAIDWLYRPFPEAADEWEEVPLAARIIEEHEGDPFYRFGPQSPTTGVAYDPSARTQDLGDDPIKAGDYGISNLKLILSHFGDWIDDDPDWSHRRELYSQLCTQYSRYLAHVAAQIGGTYLWKSAARPSVPVPAERQRESLRWLMRQLRQSTWLDAPEVTRHFGLMVPESAKAGSSLAYALGTTAPSNVQLSSCQAEASDYDIKNYYDDLLSEVFASSRSGKALTLAEKALQKQLVTSAARPLVPASKAALDEDSADCWSRDFGQADTPTQNSVDISVIEQSTGYKRIFMSKIKELAGRLRKSGPVADRAHYEYLYMCAAAALVE